MLVAGVDEAGRGPVIGDLVVAGILIEESDWEKLISLGVKDSKLLTPQKREELFPEVKKVAKKVSIKKVTPVEIDSFMNTGTNLNYIEMIKIAEILNELKPEKAYIDSPSVNNEKFKKELAEKLDFKCELVVEHKADLKYAVVGGASIIAKVTRDRDIMKLSSMLGIKTGIGYPHDETSREFVKKAIKKKELLKYVRTTWQTYKDIKGEKEQSKINQF